LVSVTLRPTFMFLIIEGASTHVLELSLALAKLGDDVHVVCRRSPHEKRSEKISGITLHRLYRGFVGPLTKKKFRMLMKAKIPTSLHLVMVLT